MSKLIIIKTEEIIEQDCWKELKEFTDARIALGRTGYSLPTREMLEFSLAHARAKDAVHLPFDKDALKQKLNSMKLEVIYTSSAAPNRTVYLTRPDLGRKLSDTGREDLLKMHADGSDVVIVIGDGLSSKAVHKQSAPLISHLLPYLTQLHLSLAPIVLAEQSRVALGDEIGQILKAKLVIMLIGERPGLSSPDSLGVYLTWMPYVGRLESERNCISNIRPEGLSYAKAAFKLAWLIEHAFDTQLSGIRLKDQSDNPDSYKLVKPVNHLLKAT
ncbi:ethanolamine ammonia-lyase subunit EutC [uncultured Bacteroides sp.]|uniref:ethanolamine ammonia-lyase subunit EutC n=1 Tax=uncultured Bacteroides sp. TaxID=162156 RepID=UPI002AA7AA1E|nr:ethanolamine ammonia-lyase subunit EutC [uncultured Bacteroides sp.]